MTDAYTGGCACRAIRYEIKAEPVQANDCQCRQCQHQTGAGHGSYLAFFGAEKSLEGEASTWDVTGDDGTLKRCAFCPICGSPVYITFPDMPDVFVIRAGSLDDPGRYQSQMVLWTAAGHGWDHLDPAVRKFERMPPK